MALSSLLIMVRTNRVDIISGFESDPSLDWTSTWLTGPVTAEELIGNSAEELTTRGDDTLWPAMLSHDRDQIGQWVDDFLTEHEIDHPAEMFIAELQESLVDPYFIEVSNPYCEPEANSIHLAYFENGEWYGSYPGMTLAPVASEVDLESNIFTTLPPVGYLSALRQLRLIEIPLISMCLDTPSPETSALPMLRSDPRAFILKVLTNYLISFVEEIATV